MADLSKLRFNGTDYNVKDASAPLRKFTNYSKTGNLPITSDDTTQTAIGKLEKAIDSDRENILYAIKTGVKNIIVLPDGVYQPSSKTTFTVVDGAVTCETTASYTDAIYISTFVIPAGTYSLTGIENNTGFQVRLYNNGTRIEGNPITLDVDTTVSVALYSLGSNSSGTLTPMICLKSIYDQDPSYVKPALTNRDLTRTVNILKMSEFNNAFGMKISKSDTNPNTKVSYMFNAEGMTPAYMDFTGGSFNFGSFSSWKPVSQNRPVGLNFNGSVAYELNHTDFSKKLDGTASDITDATTTINFMSEMPLMYVRRWEDENYNYIVFCEYQTNENYTADAFKNASGGIGSKLYLPMFKGSYVDGKLRSLAKQYWQNNADVQGTEAEWNAAAACGTGWQTWDWAKREYLSDLMTFITKSTDWKNKFGRGVTNRSTSNNNKYDGQPTGGYCSTSGDLTTWTADYHGQFYGVASTTSDKKHVTAFYVEDPYGNRWERTPGLELYNNVYRAKMSPPYALTDSASRAEYDNLGISAPAEGWFKVASTSMHGSVPVAVGASETTGYCSYFYKNASSIRLALFGGTCYYGGACGRSVILSHAPSASRWSLGASPCFVSP